MKTLRTALLIAAGLIGLALFAQQVSEQLVRIQTDPASGRVSAFFERSTSVDGVAYRQPWTEVSWQLGADKSVTVDGKTYTYAEVFAAVQAIAAQEKADQAQ